LSHHEIEEIEECTPHMRADRGSLRADRGSLRAVRGSFDLTFTLDKIETFFYITIVSFKGGMYEAKTTPPYNIFR